MVDKLLEKLKARQAQQTQAKQNVQENQFELTKWQTVGNIASGTTVKEQKTKCKYCGKNVALSKIESHQKKCLANRDNEQKSEKLFKEILESNQSLKKEIADLMGDINQLNEADIGDMIEICRRVINQLTSKAKQAKNQETSETVLIVKIATELKERLEILLKNILEKKLDKIKQVKYE